ncbi:MAG: methyl-accepting chemotaxis protein, partial [Spirochaetota bacterium]
MLKNLKIGLKIGGGFAIVLLLTALVGFIGWNGMGNAVDKVDKSNDVNGLVKDILKTRQAEKNFILRGGQEYVDQVAATVADMLKQINVTKNKFKDTVNKQQMDTVMEAVKKYEQAFSGYVGLEQQKAASDERMVTAAR